MRYHDDANRSAAVSPHMCGRSRPPSRPLSQHQIQPPLLLRDQTSCLSFPLPRLQVESRHKKNKEAHINLSMEDRLEAEFAAEMARINETTDDFLKEEEASSARHHHHHHSRRALRV